MCEKMWDGLEARVSVVGTRIIYTKDACDAAARDVGLPFLPPSYVEFVKRFGAGEWRPDFIIGVPSHPIRTMTLRYFIECQDDIFKELSRDKEIGQDYCPLQHLLCLGGSGNGMALCWNPRETRTDGEMTLWMLDDEEPKATYCGSSLLEFLRDYWIGQKLDKACPLAGTSWNSKPIFRVIGVGG